MVVEIKYVLQIKSKDTWVDTPSHWFPGYYDKNMFYEMLESNCMYAKKVEPTKEFRIIKRISKIVEEEIIIS